MGAVVTKDGVVQLFTGIYKAVAGEQTVLVDTNGTACCCNNPGCCSSCVRAVVSAGCGTCPGSTGTPPDGNWPNADRTCCYTRDIDLPVDGYWFMREDLGPDFWTIEVTQTGVATWGGSGGSSYWQFSVTIIEACRVGGNLTSTTYSDTATLYPGFVRSVVSNNDCECRHLGLPGNFTQPAGCFLTRWDDLFHPLRNIPQQNPADQFASSQNCYQDYRSGVGGPVPRSGGLVTVAFYYRVDKCSRRCTGDCASCP